eukprot:4027737-Heterocapsa_arctica.AAC.1
MESNKTSTSPPIPPPSPLLSPSPCAFNKHTPSVAGWSPAEVLSALGALSLLALLLFGRCSPVILRGGLRGLLRAGLVLDDIARKQRARE